MTDMTPDRLQELHRIASAATPGPWIKDADKRYSVRSHWNPPRDGNVVGWRVCVVSGNGPQSDADWDYITEFNPKTTLALLDRIEALERRDSEVTRLILDAITWLYDEDANSVAVDESDRKRGLEQLRRALLLLDPAEAARFPNFWQW